MQLKLIQLSSIQEYECDEKRGNPCFQNVPFRTPEKTLASDYPWNFRIILQASPHLLNPRNAFRTLEDLLASNQPWNF